MRVFVTGTGRCGTSTFYQACRYLRDYTAGHESFVARLPTWEFPDQHVEVASQLAYAIPVLRRRYPDARWVHLIRDRAPCVESLARQCWDSMAAFALQWFLVEHPYDILGAAGQFYDLTNDLISALIPTGSLLVRIETVQEQWPGFCEWLDAECDGDAVAEVFSRAYNPGVNRGRDAFVELV